MKEHPILFSAEMVRAILDGRKTQTRRICKFEATDSWEIDCLVRNGVYFRIKDRPDIPSKRVDFPYGQVGDRLWVRENIRTLVCQSNNKTWEYGEFEIEYIADKTIIRCPDEHEEWWRHNWHIRPATTIPSIHMPKWAARIFLGITGLRVERVQDINWRDCKAEGIALIGDELVFNNQKQKHSLLRTKFNRLWDSINSKRGYGWDKNPWVWVIEFKIEKG